MFGEDRPIPDVKKYSQFSAAWSQGEGRCRGVVMIFCWRGFVSWGFTAGMQPLLGAWRCA